MVELAVGDEIGPFTVERVLSSGGMAFIYKVRLTTLKEGYPAHVVVKMARQGYEDFLLDEEEHLRNLYHPHIIRPVPILTETGEIWQERYIRRSTTGKPPLWYMVLEYLEGHSLAELLQSKKRLPLAMAVGIASQVGMALDYLHRIRGVAHLDVRPDNILFRRNPSSPHWEPNAVLCDLGIAWHNKRVPTDSYGDLPYVAPERRRGQRVTFSSDVYALGITMYEMVTGVRPYPQDEDEPDEAHPGLNKSVPIPPRELCRSTQQIDEIILRAIARRPEERYSTISEFLRDLAPVEIDARTHSSLSNLGWTKLAKIGGGLILVSMLMVGSFFVGWQIQNLPTPAPEHTAPIVLTQPAGETPTEADPTTTSIPTQLETEPPAPTLPSVISTEPTEPPPEETRATATPWPTKTPTMTPIPTIAPTATWTPTTTVTLESGP